MDCPDDNLLAAFADGILTAGERSAVEEHIDQCDVCRRAVSALATGLARRDGSLGMAVIPSTVPINADDIHLPLYVRNNTPLPARARLDLVIPGEKGPVWASSTPLSVNPKSALAVAPALPTRGQAFAIARERPHAMKLELYEVRTDRSGGAKDVLVESREMQFQVYDYTVSAGRWQPLKYLKSITGRA